MPLLVRREEAYGDRVEGRLTRGRRARDRRKGNGAQERTRTSTPLRAPAPEAGASTNSAIWARGRGRPLGGGLAACQPRLGRLHGNRRRGMGEAASAHEDLWDGRAGCSVRRRWFSGP